MKKQIAIFATVVVLISCKKTTPLVSTCMPDETTIAGKYIIKSLKYKMEGGVSETDMFALMEDCQKDDTYELKTDGTVIVSEATDNCGLPPLPGAPGNWTLTNNNTILMMNGNLKILSFDCSKLVVEERNVMVDGDVKTTSYEKL